MAEEAFATEAAMLTASRVWRHGEDQRASAHQRAQTSMISASFFAVISSTCLM